MNIDDDDADADDDDDDDDDEGHHIVNQLLGAHIPSLHIPGVRNAWFWSY